MIEPGPRTGRKEKPGLYPTWTAALLYMAIALAVSATVVSAALLVWLVASGRI